MKKTDSFVQEYENLPFSNDFLFCRIMETRKDLCEQLLSLILQKKVVGIDYPDKQKPFDLSRDAKSVRLDVYVESGDGTEVYDIEMQPTHQRELGKRSRYYHSMLDASMIEKGQPYRDLKQSYVIFICLFDHFGQGLPLYTFRTLCGDLELDDGRYTVFVNAECVSSGNEQLDEFLAYLRDGIPTGAFTEQLEDAASVGRRNKEWRRIYMTLLMRDQENLQKGREEGREEGRSDALKDIRTVTQYLLSHGRQQELNDLLANPETLDDVMKKYGLK